MSYDSIIGTLGLIVSILSLIIPLVINQKDEKLEISIEEQIKESHTHNIPDEIYPSRNNKKKNTRSRSSSQSEFELIIALCLIALSSFVFMIFQNVIFSITAIISSIVIVIFSINLHKRKHVFSKKFKIAIIFFLAFVLISIPFVKFDLKTPDSYQNFMNSWMLMKNSFKFNTFSNLITSLLNIIISFVKLSWGNMMMFAYLSLKIGGFFILILSLKDIFFWAIKISKGNKIATNLGKRLKVQIPILFINFFALSGLWINIYEIIKPYFK